ncbi:hypothetical protein OHA91_39520 (plasmid) [Streptomyces erythrochromogenes]|uniref:Uncharacterized protein n=1 Tax=Streptomyces erythrochromogenes TaxID=285574 RepID=A0ABZ1QPN5_9ACTN|nr:hypothetical protein [Streptomyces erythrochromogenes]
MNTDWYVQLVPPVDFFDGMISVGRYLSSPTNTKINNPWDLDHAMEQAKERLEWVEGAMKALEHVSRSVRWGWEGDFRHEPYVGALPWSGASYPYLVVKQENNGSCYLVSQGFAVPMESELAVMDVAKVSAAELA